MANVDTFRLHEHLRLFDLTRNYPNLVSGCESQRLSCQVSESDLRCTVHKEAQVAIPLLFNQSHIEPRTVFISRAHCPIPYEHVSFGCLLTAKIKPYITQI